MSNINSVLVYEEETNLNLLHVLSANDGVYKEAALRCLLDENAKSVNKPKLDINRKSGPGNDCWTAIHLACCFGNLSILEILLDNGADPEIADKNGLDCLDIATAFDQFRCLDLMRRKMKSSAFSKVDLNKSCDTVFYSFLDTHPNSFRDPFQDSIKLCSFNETVAKMDAQVQTSGQFNQSVGDPHSNHSTEHPANNTDDRSKTERKANKSRPIDDEKPTSSASKVLDRHREEYEQTKKSNSTFIRDYANKPPAKAGALNELRKDLLSKSVDCKAMNRSSDPTVSGDRTLERSTGGRNVIRNLRKSFRSCNNEDGASSGDDSISPFDTISTIALGENRELYVDSEFNITFVNEITAGLSQLATSDSDRSKANDSRPQDRFETNDSRPNNRTETNDSLAHSRLTDDLDSTLQDQEGRLEIEINVQINRSINERLNDLGDHPIGRLQINYQPAASRRSQQTIDYESLDDDQLFGELVAAGLRPGPVNANTRSVYIKKLDELRASGDVKLNNEISTLSCSVSERLTMPDSSLLFSRPLREMMNGRFDFRLARQIESEFIQNFDSQPSSRKQFFNYLLLDPRITQNLVKRSLEENPQLISQLNSPPRVRTQAKSAGSARSPDSGAASSETNGQFNHFNLALFKLFILAIFYIGKGQGNRPYSHLYDASKLDRQRGCCRKSNIQKLVKIQEIWTANKGVISLHCFHNTSSMEALTRECFMIDAIGIKHLTNIQIGQNRTKNLRWTQYKKDVLGAWMLYKAYNLLLVNGERQIKRADISD